MAEDGKITLAVGVDTKSLDTEVKQLAYKFKLAQTEVKKTEEEVSELKRRLDGLKSGEIKVEDKGITKAQAEFDELLILQEILLDFWASWCGPCKMLSPVLSEIADEYADVLKVAKVNVDDEPELAMKFKVSSIPMLVLFKDGRIVSTSVGYRPKDEILNELKQYMNRG